MEELCAEQNPSLPFGHLLPDQCIDHAVLVFQGQEGHATSRLRPLPKAHQPCELDTASMRNCSQFRGPLAAPCLKLSAQKAQRMAAECQSGHRVIRDHIFAGRGHGEGEYGFWCSRYLVKQG